MAEQLQRLKPGERLDGIPAPTWNAFVDAAEYVGRLRGSQQVEPLRHVPQTGIVRLKNASGQTRNRFDVLGISDVFPQPAQNLGAFKSGPVLHGVTPDENEHAGNFAILLEPAKPDAIVAACVSGACVAKVHVETGQESVGYADVKDGDAGALQAKADGTARILWREPGTGIKWAVVRIGGGGGASVGPATMIRAQVDEPDGVEHTDGSFSIDNVSILAPSGATEYPGGSAPTSAVNLLGFPVLDDAAVIAFWDPGPEVWLGIPKPFLRVWEPCESSL